MSLNHTATELWSGELSCSWVGCAAERMAPTAQTLMSEWVSEWVTAAPLSLGEKSLVLAGECGWARARASHCKARTAPIAKEFIVSYLLPALLMIRVTPQMGRTAGSTVVRLMNNWTDSLEAPINSRKSFIETSAQLNKIDDFGTQRIKNFLNFLHNSLQKLICSLPEPQD